MKDVHDKESIGKNTVNYFSVIMLIMLVSVVVFAGWLFNTAYQSRLNEEKQWSSQCVYDAQLSVYHPNEWTTEKFYKPIDFCQVKLYKFENGTSSEFYVRYTDDYRTQFHKVSIETKLDCNPVGFNDQIGKFICSSGKFANEVDNFQ